MNLDIAAARRGPAHPSQAFLPTKRSSWGPVGVLGIICLALIVVSPSDYMFRIATQVMVYSALAMGLNVVVGLAGLLDLGFIAFFGVGAYGYALLASDLHGIHISFWLMLPVGMLLAALLGILVGLPALRTHGDYLAIVTLGFGEIVSVLLVNLDRPVNITNGPQGVLGIDLPSVAGFQIGADDVFFGGFGLTTTMQFFMLTALYCLGVMFACLRLRNARVGRAWRAMRESEAAANACGISVVRAKLSAFVFGAAVAGGAGVITAAWYGSVFPDSFLFSESIKVLAMVVLGGIGSVWGAIAGALVLVLMPELLREFDQYRLLIFGLVLVLAMRLRPQGLLGSRSPGASRRRLPAWLASRRKGVR
ncbi:MAG: transporter ATP-binding protein [Frankiales bacterium]|nr:transporter ATP-binding protein [Frankiales bacterium]